MIEGACLCGDIAFEITGAIEEISHCHCTMCRKAHGSIFATYASVAADGFRWTGGEDKIVAFQSSQHLTRSFCKRCGSVVPSTGKSKVHVPAGLIARDTSGRVVGHIFYGDKPAWVEIEDDLPKFAGYEDERYEAVPFERQAETNDGATSGSCLCGKVHFQFTGTPMLMMNCHCSRCQKAKAAAHATNVFVAPDQFSWTRGAEHVVTYHHADAKVFGHAFCETCGSSLPRQAPGAERVNIPAGALDGDPGIKAKAHLYVSSKAPWYEPSDGLPQYDEMPTG